MCIRDRPVISYLRAVTHDCYLYSNRLSIQQQWYSYSTYKYLTGRTQNTKGKKKRRPAITERKIVPSAFPQRHEQEGKDEKLHIIREDKGKQTYQKQTTKTRATEAANKANRTKLNNGSKQRR